MDQETTAEKQQQHRNNSTLLGTHQNQSAQNTHRTSFLIEDILYRHQKEMANTFPSHYQPQSSKTSSTAGYFQNFQQQQPSNDGGSNGGYVQVMGALGAYLGATTPYNTISDPYFLAQGIFHTTTKKKRTHTNVIHKIY